MYEIGCIMNSKSVNVQDTSTPKRRRLGTGRILRPNNKENKLLLLNHSPIHRQLSSTTTAPVCESPPLPSNQIKFLHDSRNSSVGEIPSSPGLFESISASNVDSLCMNDVRTENNVSEFDDISDDMFHSRLEQECSQLSKHETTKDRKSLSENAVVSTSPKLDLSFVSGRQMLELKLSAESQQNHVVSSENEEVEELLTSRCEKHFRDDIEESFELINQSICGINEETKKKSERSSLFETHDSFLLDIKESGIISNDKQNNVFVKPKTPLDVRLNFDTFYGLPMITKSLFKNFRNIDKFYGRYFFKIICFSTLLNFN